MRLLGRLHAAVTLSLSVFLYLNLSWPLVSPIKVSRLRRSWPGPVPFSFPFLFEPALCSCDLALKVTPDNKTWQAAVKDKRFHLTIFQISDNAFRQVVFTVWPAWVIQDLSGYSAFLLNPRRIIHYNIWWSVLSASHTFPIKSKSDYHSVYFVLLVQHHNHIKISVYCNHYSSWESCWVRLTALLQ